MPAYTKYTLTEDQTWQLDGVKGSLAVANRSASAVVTVLLDKLSGPSETVTLSTLGDSLTANTEPYRKVTITSSVYPTDILLEVSPAHDIAIASIVPAALTPSGTGLPGTVHVDAEVTSAGTTTLWTPAAGNRFVIASLVLTQDTAQRSVLFDGTDARGNRIAELNIIGTMGRYGAPLYVSLAVGQLLKLTTGAAGTVFAAVDGYEQVG